MSATELLANPSLRRYSALLLAPLVAIANKKFGLSLEPMEVVTLIASAALYILGSNYKEAAVAKANAAGLAAGAKVDSPAAAAAVLNEAKP